MKKTFWAHIILLCFIAFICVAITVSDQATANNSKENEEPADGEVISAEYQANTPDDHALPQTSVPSSTSCFNTDYLDMWCGEPVGQIRMIGGWYNSPDTIETEDGNLWELNTEDINEWELLLVWFDDMGTPDIQDDQIIKVWSEVYD